MPPTPTPPKPILIPRLPSPPLSPPLLTSLQRTLLTPKTIRTLRTTLDAETRAAAWQEKVKRRTLQLLQEKEYWKWEELVGVVVGEARGGEEDDDGQEGQGYEEKEGVKGKGEKGKVDIRIPEKAIAEAAKVVKGVLEKKVELEPEGKGFWD